VEQKNYTQDHLKIWEGTNGRQGGNGEKKESRKNKIIGQRNVDSRARFGCRLGGTANKKEEGGGVTNRTVEGMKVPPFELLGEFGNGKEICGIHKVGISRGRKKEKKK